MLFSKRGATATMYFMIGLILAVMSITMYAQVLAPIIRSPDKSIESADALANMIMSSVESQKQYAEYVKLNIEKDELMLLFDKGVNNFVLFYRERRSFSYSDFDKGPFFLRNKDYSYDYFSGKKDAFFVFQKPRDCGNETCVVLCRNVVVARKSNIKFNFTDEHVYRVTDSKNNLFEVSCSDNYVRTIPNVGKIYRKPFFFLSKPDMVKAFSISLTGKDDEEFDTSSYRSLEKIREKFPPSKIDGYSVASIGGAYLQSSHFFYPKEEDKRRQFFSFTKIIDKYFEVGEETKLKFSSIPFYLSERKETNWTKLFWVIRDYPLYVQPYGDDVALCYQPPCLDQEDENYMNIKTHLDNCLETSSRCGSFMLGLELFYNSYHEPVVLKNQDSKFYFEYGDESYLYDNDIEMYITGEYKTDTFDENYLGPYNELSFEVKKLRLISKTYDKLVMVLGGDSYLVSSISSLMPEDEDEKPRLIFIVGDKYEEQTI